jgi:mannose-6-phosphate isomerase-like protein (cupin superfamily)
LRKRNGARVAGRRRLIYEWCRHPSPHPMNIASIHRATSWFEVLQTTERSQTAVMTLIPGGESGPRTEAHEKSDQAILMVSGRMKGEIEEDIVHLEPGDSIIIPAGVSHRFVNECEMPAVSFSVYSPPEYEADEKG